MRVSTLARTSLRPWETEPATATPCRVSRRGGAGSIKVAYLTNVYPKLSHSFIRREIEALERHGVVVERFTIRRAAREQLIDADDLREDARTTAILDGDPIALIGALVAAAWRAPAGFAGALRMTWRTARHAGPLRACAYLAESARLVAAMNRVGARHLHVHFGTNPAAVARLARALSGISFSVTVHGPDEFDAPVALELAAKLKDAAFTVAISDYGRGQLMRWSDVAHWPRIEVVRCGVDQAFFAAPLAAGAAGLESRRLVCISRLSAQKGLPLLIDAVARIRSRCPLELRIIGEGEQRAALQAQIARRGLTDCVQLVGARDAHGVRTELLAARAFVLPSFAEGLPVVLMEALAIGRPVITTAVAGVPELVDPQCGWIVPAGSVTALARAIEAALSARPGRLAMMAAEGRARARRLHDGERTAGELATLLRQWA